MKIGVGLKSYERIVSTSLRGQKRGTYWVALNDDQVCNIKDEKNATESLNTILLNQLLRTYQK